jgi:expansin (peptidoglycan-binding protein)
MRSPALSVFPSPSLSFLILISISTLPLAEINYDAGEQSGRITYYEQSPTVACDIPQSEWPRCTAALNESEFQGGLACGATARLRNNGKEIEVMIVDLCPVQGNEQWCSGDKPHFDLGGSSTFSQLEPPLTGVKDISFEWLPTPVGDTPVKLRFKDGVNPWWVAIQVLNHRYPVAMLEIQDPQNSQWRTGNRALAGMWNYWQFDFTGNGLAPPFNIRITDQYGQVIEEKAAVVQEKYLWSGVHQFPLLPRHADSSEVSALRERGPEKPVYIHGNKIVVSDPSELRIELFDSFGRTVMSKATRGNGNIGIPRNRPAMYLIVVKTGSDSRILRWMRMGMADSGPK